MAEMIEIIPAIIPESLDDIEEKMEKVKGLVSRVQVDFVDGKYAPTLTWPFNMTAGFKDKLKFAEEVVLEADLMIQNPEDFINDLIKIGFKSFVIHLDSTNYIEKCVQIAKNGNCKVGLGLKPSLSLPAEKIISLFDFIQFMGSDRVGYNGVELDPRVPEKIYRFHLQHSSLPIQVDIGVNQETVAELRRAGANALVSGSAVFKGKKIKENIEKLKSI